MVVIVMMIKMMLIMKEMIMRMEWTSCIFIHFMIDLE